MSNFDWRCYFELAENSLTKLNTESAKRSAISRAYYAAVQAARIHIESRGGFIDPDKKWHSQVVYGIARHNSNVSSKLSSLRTCRNEADYSDAIDDLDGKVSDCLANAKAVLDILKSSQKP